MESIAPAATKGFDSLFNIAPIVTVLILVILVMGYFIRALLIDAKEERRLYRDTLDSNTKALTSLEGVIRAAINFK